MKNKLLYFHTEGEGLSVPSEADGRFPIDQAAGLLAVHCLIRDKSPKDFIVTVQIDELLSSELLRKVEVLIEVARGAARQKLDLSNRQWQVFNGIVHKRQCNKEIACDLNISERTVKFHVSALLAKFGVSSRLELAGKAEHRTVGDLVGEGKVIEMASSTGESHERAA